MEDDFVLKVIKDINQIRTNPKNCTKRFEDLKIGLSRMKGTKDVVKEVDNIIDQLKNSSGLPELSYSKELSKVATFQTEIYKKQNKFTSNDDQSVLEARAKNFVQNFTKLIQLSDKGAEEPVEVVNRLVLSKTDTEKKNRKTLFDPELKQIGIDAFKQDDEYVVVLVFSDTIVTAKIDHPVEEITFDQVLINKINYIRANPSKYVATYEKLVGNKNKKIDAEAKELVGLLKTNNKIISSLKRNDLLRTLADELLNNYIENGNAIVEEKDLINFAKKKYYGINVIGAFYVSVEDESPNAEDIISNILLNDQNKYPGARNLLLTNDKIKLMDLAINKENGNTIVIVLVDNIYEPFEETFVSEINKIREDPKYINPDLKRYKDSLKTLSSKTEITNDINNLMQKFKDQQEKLPHFIVNQGLNDAAREYLDLLQDSKSYYAQDEEDLKLRLSHYIQGVTKAKEFVHVGTPSAKQVLLDLLISEKDKEKKSRQILLGNEFKFVGVAAEVIKGKNVTVIILTDNAEELVQGPFVEELLKEINHIRSHPKTYIKYFKQYSDSLDNKSNNKKMELAVFMNFLKKTRTFGPITLDSTLNKAAEQRLENYKEDHRTMIATEEDLRTFLSDFATDFNNIAEMFDSSASARDLIINQLVNQETKAREIIFSKKYYLAGFAYDQESEKCIIILADNIESKILEEEDSSFLSRVKRPNLTEDEIKQIKKDFRKFDVLNQGIIHPQGVLVFMENSPDFKEQNPVYFKATTILAEEDKDNKGINVEQFIEAIQKVFSAFDDEAWGSIFYKYKVDSKKKTIDYDNFVTVVKMLGHNFTEEMLQETFAKITDETNQITYDKFIEIMNIVEGLNRK
jgi:uncharacterized protein YkwD/Ca2+-binding EF-hand superfamily protein